MAFTGVFSSTILAVGITASPVLATVTCANTSTGTTALTDLGTGSYQGEQGGLYPGGSNVAPAAYRSAGIQAASSVVPLNTSGNASGSGNIVFISIGMSNTSLEFASFASNETTDAARGSAVAIVDGAQAGRTADQWVSPSAATWGVVDQRLAAAGFTDQQVEAIWLKQADIIRQPLTFESYARTLSQQLSTIVSIAAQKYPHLQEVFVSPRTYGGYSPDGPNPEPYAYQTGFADKWLVAQSVASPASRPWIGWGPYLWTDGTAGRADGFKWYCADTRDGTHPSAGGLVKINSLMHSQFTTSVFSPWFGSAASAPPPSPSPSPVPRPTPSAIPHSSPSAGGASPGSTSQAGTGHSTSGQGSNTSGVGGSSPPAVINRSALAGASAALSTASRNWPLTIGVILLLVAAGITVVNSILRRRRRRVRPAVVVRPPPPGTNVAQPGLPPGASHEPVEPPLLAGSRPGGDAGKPPTP